MALIRFGEFRLALGFLIVVLLATWLIVAAVFADLNVGFVWVREQGVPGEMNVSTGRPRSLGNVF